jgi:DASS family divalent anion:Na+ symporter
MSANEAAITPEKEPEKSPDGGKGSEKKEATIFGVSKKLIGLIVCAIVGVVMFIFPIPALGEHGSYIFASVVVMILALIFELLPIGIVVMIWVMFLLGSNLVKPGVALQGFTDKTTWLILGAFMIGEAAVITNFAKRIAYSLLRVAGTNYRRITLMLYFIGWLLGLVIPSGTARMAIVFPIFLGLLTAFKCRPNSNESLDLMLQVKWAFSTGGPSVAWLTGSAVNPVIMSILTNTTGVEVTWTQWAMWMFVPTLVIAFLMWWTTSLFTRSKMSADISMDGVKDELSSLGKMSKSELTAAIWMGVAVLLWATSEWTEIDPGWSAMLVGCLLFAPKIGVLKKSSLKSIDWNMVLFCGGAISMAAVLAEAGIATWLVDVLMRPLMAPFSALGDLGSFAGIWLFGFLMHFLIPSGVSTAAAVAPLSIGYAVEAGLNPIITAFMVNFGNRPFVFPYQIMSVMLLWGYAQPSIGKAAKVLLLQAVVWFIFSLAVAAFLMLIVPAV